MCQGIGIEGDVVKDIHEIAGIVARVTASGYPQGPIPVSPETREPPQQQEIPRFHQRSQPSVRRIRGSTERLPEQHGLAERLRTERQSRALLRTDENESAYSMLTTRIGTLSDPQFTILINNKYIN